MSDHAKVVFKKGDEIELTEDVLLYLAGYTGVSLPKGSRGILRSDKALKFAGTLWIVVFSGVTAYIDEKAMRHYVDLSYDPMQSATQVLDDLERRNRENPPIARLISKEPKDGFVYNSHLGIYEEKDSAFRERIKQREAIRAELHQTVDLEAYRDQALAEAFLQVASSLGAAIEPDAYRRYVEPALEKMRKDIPRSPSAGYKTDPMAATRLKLLCKMLGLRSAFNLTDYDDPEALFTIFGRMRFNLSEKLANHGLREDQKETMWGVIRRLERSGSELAKGESVVLRTLMGKDND